VAWFGGCALALCLPWMVRNQRVLGTWQLRPNFGVELRIGNHDLATGRPEPVRYHPSHVEAERELYLELGEAAYCRENTARARAWIGAHPAAFLRLTAKRAALFWVGEPPGRDPRRSAGLAPAGDPASWIKYLAFALSGALALAAVALVELPREAKLLVAGSLLLYGAPYYATHVSERYRFPIDPLVVLLDAWILLRALRWARRAGRRHELDREGQGVE
jgi:hypothetical protein